MTEDQSSTEVALLLCIIMQKCLSVIKLKHINFPLIFCVECMLHLRDMFKIVHA